MKNFLNYRAMIKKAKLSVLLLISVSAVTIQAADITVSDADYQDYYDELKVRGLAPENGLLFPFGFRSYLLLEDSVKDMRIQKPIISTLDLIPEDQVRFLGVIKGWAGKNEDSKTTVADFKGGLTLGSGDWSLVGTYVGVSGNDFDEVYYGYQWRGVKAKTDQIYLRRSGQRVCFQIGKDYIRYGLGLGLSGNAPFEKIQAVVTLGEHVALQGFMGKLDGWTYQDVFVNRYLAGHRAELNYGPARLGLNELVLYGGPGRTAEMYYLLPLYFFLGEQQNRDIDDNIIWDMDLSLNLPPVHFAGEIMIDDIQIEDKTAGDKEPSETGLGIKMDWAVVSQPFFLTTSASYRMVTNWTFNQNKDWNRFLFEGQPIGPEEGNDFDRLSLKLTARTSSWLGTGEIYHMRKGEGRINDDWTSPWVNDSTWLETFPTGIVERSLGFELGFEWRPAVLQKYSAGMPLDLFSQWQYEDVKNYSNSAGRNEKRWAVKIGMGIGLSGKLISLEEK
jgi:hypothetical protein